MKGVVCTAFPSAYESGEFEKPGRATSHDGQNRETKQGADSPQETSNLEHISRSLLLMNYTNPLYG